MRTNLLMNFEVDKDNKKIKVEREFAAPLEKVWAAWTQSELLDQWWAPKPYKAKTKSMDFRAGGAWIYSMIGPDGREHFSRADYTLIDPSKSFSARDAFCDEKGIINETLPRLNWTVSFNGKGESTIVNIEIEAKQLADIEKIIEMGFKEGFTAGLENLDALLQSSLNK